MIGGALGAGLAAKDEDRKKKRKEKRKKIMAKLKKARNKAMNFSANATGATSVARVGGNLVKNLTRKKGSKPIPLYKKGDYKSLAKDLVGIGTFGSIAKGALKLGAKGVSKGISKGTKISDVRAQRIKDRIARAKWLRKMGMKPMKYK